MRKYFTEYEKRQAVNNNNKKWRQKHKKEISLYNKEYHKKYQEELNFKKREYRKKHKDIDIFYRKTHKEKTNQQICKREKEDLNFKLSRRLRTRLGRAINRNQKSGSAVQDLGCSISELKTHLESKFQNGMNWGNYGYWGWHIDHIKPLDSFDLTNREEFLKANHYTNLQPMWAKENLIKGNK